MKLESWTKIWKFEKKLAKNLEIWKNFGNWGKFGNKL